MLKKQQRLTWKDINFLFKKQKLIWAKSFSFFYFDQYPNRQYNQFSAQIPVKLSKHATTRNLIKRVIYDYIRTNGFISKKFKDKYQKVFVFLNKTGIENIKKTIETPDKKFIRKEIERMFAESFSTLVYRLWKY